MWPYWIGPYMAQAAWTPQQTKTVALRIIASHSVSPTGPNVYGVESQSNPGRSYVVA